MSAKFSTTTADHLEWSQAMNLIRNLFNDGDYKMSLMIALGTFWGLRISDLLKLKYSQVYNVDEITIVEQKTGKTREIRVNAQLKRHIADCYEKLNPRTPDDFIFTSQKKSIYSIQRINVLFKEINVKYNLKIKNCSTHSMRKGFGREIFNRSGSNAELALMKLSQLFNHSNPAITRRYLGIAKEELMQTYDILGF
jgi:integrase